MVIVVAKAKAKKSKRKLGATWGLSVTRTLRRIFRENRDKQWTDNEITDFLIEEFGVDRKMYHQVSMLRWHYNQGNYTRDPETGKPVIPKKLSKRYGKLVRTGWRKKFK